ncbi:MAG: metallophosphoesterase [Bacteroidota bacterium]
MNRMIRLFRNAVTALLLFPLVAVAQNGSVGITYSLDSTVAIFGDTRTGHAIHRKVVQCILKTQPCAVFNLGDLVWNGHSKKLWKLFNEIEGPLLKDTKYYVAAGNHELGAKLFRKNFVLPGNGLWYSVNMLGVHFIVLDNTSDFTKGSPQYKWLKNDLENIPANIRFRVVVQHYPPYTTGAHRDRCKKLQKHLVPLFEKYHVDIVFAGHNHGYERSLVNGVYYITTAGGGAPLHDQNFTSPYSQVYIKNYNFCSLTANNEQLKVTALDTAMKTIDAFVVRKK